MEKLEVHDVFFFVEHQVQKGKETNRKPAKKLDQ